MNFRYFTTAEWAAVPPAQKREVEQSRILGGRLITRTIKLHADASGKETVAIVNDNPRISEVTASTPCCERKGNEPHRSGCHYEGDDLDLP